MLRGGALRHDADTEDVLKRAGTRTDYGVFAYVCKWLTLANYNSNRRGVCVYGSQVQLPL